MQAVYLKVLLGHGDSLVPCVKHWLAAVNLARHFVFTNFTR